MSDLYSQSISTGPDPESAPCVEASMDVPINPIGLGCLLQIRAVHALHYYYRDPEYALLKRTLDFGNQSLEDLYGILSFEPLMHFSLKKQVSPSVLPVRVGMVLSFQPSGFVTSNCFRSTAGHIHRYFMGATIVKEWSKIV